MLVSTWLNGGRDVAWVGVERDETDPIRFWAAVMDALRASGALADGRPAGHARRRRRRAGRTSSSRACSTGSTGCRARSCSCSTTCTSCARRRRSGASSSCSARRPSSCATIVISRREPKLGLHRLRLAGELTGAARRRPPLHRRGGGRAAGRRRASRSQTSDVSRLHERTEGWAAGLRLAALSLARHDAPARFVAEFSGSERTVADYLLDEVLASQPPEVRSLLLRTCILERVNGPLADLLTGRGDGARLLHELEEANAFVVAVDVARTWFRYHHLLADLLRLELQREAPETVVELHRLAARLARRARPRGRGDPPRGPRPRLGAGGRAARPPLGPPAARRRGPDARRAARGAAAGADRRRRRARHHRRRGHARRGALGRGRRPHRRRPGGAAGAAGRRAATAPRPALASVELLRARRVGDLAGALERGDRAPARRRRTGRRRARGVRR